MTVDAEQVLCRFQLSNFVRHGTAPMYEWIVQTAHQQGLQGATVLKGIFGLRAEGSLLEQHRWSISEELPVIVEVVDEAARIESLLAIVEPVFREGAITLERAHVRYRPRPVHHRRALHGRSSTPPRTARRPECEP